MPTATGTVEQAVELMAAFAERTGLTSSRPERRYLWTDAFAVCNFLALARRTGDERPRELALRLVERVHRVLGRFRDDDVRHGWLSGLDERAGAEHPTRGGLRIGKPLPERPPGEPLQGGNEALEWERDGQYFHYLTKWMHALEQVARATGEARFHLWARELAAAAHAAFVVGPSGPGPRRMIWKASTDLTRALVPSMGQHDALDGFLSCLEVEAAAARLALPAAGPDLAPALADFAALLARTDLRTADPLGLGGLLVDAWRVVELRRLGAFPGDAAGERFLLALLEAAEDGLAHHAAGDATRQPAAARLAFRELGLALGLTALERLASGPEASGALRARVERLRPSLARGPALTAFWLAPASRATRTWAEHRDIDEVMLATCLVPEGFLDLSAAA